MSEGSDSIVQVMTGLLGALLLGVSTLPLYPLLLLWDPLWAFSHLFWLIIPNFAFTGLIPAVISGFMREVPRPLDGQPPPNLHSPDSSSKLDGDGYRVFRMYDGEE